ncbi:MAG: hypothetical protein K2J37_04225, partial [Ruminococcus sp.]|nr:hypothetical protein [Ruminococcus sp.]
DWQKPYQEQISSFIASDEFSDDSENGSAFDLFDITGDGQPELIISPDRGASTACSIFTSDNGKIVPLGTFGSGGILRYIPSQKLLNEEYTGNGFVLGKYLTYRNGELTDVITYSDNSSSASSGATIIHEINGEEVMLPEYEAALSPYASAVYLEIGRRYTFSETAVKYAVKLSESWKEAFSDNEKQLCRDKLNEILESSAETGIDPAFDLCDLNGDKIPELIVSDGSAPESACTVYYLSEENLLQMEGTYGFCGQFTLDPKENVFFYQSGERFSYWSIANSEFTASGYKNDGNKAQIGRRYMLTPENITRIFG